MELIAHTEYKIGDPFWYINQHLADDVNLFEI